MAPFGFSINTNENIDTIKELISTLVGTKVTEDCLVDVDSNCIILQFDNGVVINFPLMYCNVFVMTEEEKLALEQTS